MNHYIYVILYQEFYGSKLRDIFVLPVFFSYSCGTRHCPWNDYQEDEDFGFYPHADERCNECQDKCNNDTNCGGIECGNHGPTADKNYCSWWKQGRCVTEDEQTIEDNSYETC